MEQTELYHLKHEMTTIVNAEYTTDRFDEKTVFIEMRLGLSMSQGFGCFNFRSQEKMEKFFKDVLELFEVTSKEQLIGRGCLCFMRDGFIVAIENPLNQKYLITDNWFKENYPQ